jgi:hypothetical protein
MPIPSNDAWGRVSKVTRYVEGMRRNPSDPTSRIVASGPELHWVKLTADLTVGGTADGHLMRWSVADDEYQENEDITVTVRDTRSVIHGKSGDSLLCRLLGTSDGMVYEPVVRVFPILCDGLVTAAVAKTSSTFNVDNVKDIDGNEILGITSTDTVEVDNPFKWEANDNQQCRFALKDMTHGAFITGGCKADFTT